MTEDSLAVYVNGVSRIYRLWNLPKLRLALSLKRLWTALLCAKGWKKETKSAPAYQEFYAINAVSLAIQKGESWGIIGVNGSGKSTLLNMISGNLCPSSGWIEVDGRVVILDYHNGFNGDFTGKDNIFVKAALLGLTRKQIKARYDAIVAFAGLGEFIHQPVKMYSSGMIARLGFAIIAHVDADIIIADEALAVGDVFFVQKCMAFIHQFIKKGTFILVSHSPTDVLAFCEKALWLEQGEINAIGTAACVTQAYLTNTKERMPPRFSESTQKKQLMAGDNTVRVLGQLALIPAIVPDKKNDKSWQANSAQTAATRPLPLFETDGSNDTGGASITEVTLTDEQGAPISRMIGGELVTLRIKMTAEQALPSPVIGFQLLDKLGQVLLANNTFLSTAERAFDLERERSVVARFVFGLPLLPAGSYVIRAFAAVLDEDERPRLLHTANNDWVIHSVTTGMRHGLIGIPLLSMKLKCKVVGGGGDAH